MDTRIRRYVATYRDRQFANYRDIVTAGGDADVAHLAYMAAAGLDHVARSAAIGLDPTTVVAHNLAAFRSVAAGSPSALASSYAGLIADVFVSIEHRMGNIGEPLHEDEGADEEPLTVPEVWPELVPESEPVPA